MRPASFLFVVNLVQVYVSCHACFERARFSFLDLSLGALKAWLFVNRLIPDLFGVRARNNDTSLLVAIICLVCGVSADLALVIP